MPDDGIENENGAPACARVPLGLHDAIVSADELQPPSVGMVGDRRRALVTGASGTSTRSGRPSKASTPPSISPRRRRSTPSWRTCLGTTPQEPATSSREHEVRRVAFASSNPVIGQHEADGAPWPRRRQGVGRIELGPAGRSIRCVEGVR
jgi:hypothetical protein